MGEIILLLPLEKGPDLARGNLESRDGKTDARGRGLGRERADFLGGWTSNASLKENGGRMLEYPPPSVHPANLKITQVRAGDAGRNLRD